MVRLYRGLVAMALAVLVTASLPIGAFALDPDVSVPANGTGPNGATQHTLWYGDTSQYAAGEARFTWQIAPGATAYFRWTCNGGATGPTQTGVGGTSGVTTNVSGSTYAAAQVEFISGGGGATYCAFSLWSTGGAFRVSNASMHFVWGDNSGGGTLATPTPSPSPSPSPTATPSCGDWEEFSIIDSGVNGGAAFSVYKYVPCAAAGSGADGALFALSPETTMPTVIGNGGGNRRLYWRGHDLSRTAPGYWRQSFRNGSPGTEYDQSGGTYYNSDGNAFTGSTSGGLTNGSTLRFYGQCGYGACGGGVPGTDYDAGGGMEWWWSPLLSTNVEPWEASPSPAASATPTPTPAPSGLDSDGDGYSDQVEAGAGTDPGDPNSYPGYNLPPGGNTGGGGGTGGDDWQYDGDDIDGGTPPAPGDDGTPGSSGGGSGIAECTTSDVTLKVGYQPYDDVPDTDDLAARLNGKDALDGFGTAIGWMGDMLWTLPNRIGNGIKWAVNTVVDFIIPGDCLTDIIEARMTDIQAEPPFSLFTEVNDLMSSSGAGSASLGSIPLPGGETIAFPMDALEDAAGVRPVLVGIVWLAAALAILSLIAGTFGVKGTGE